MTSTKLPSSVRLTEIYSDCKVGKAIVVIAAELGEKITVKEIRAKGGSTDLVDTKHISSRRREKSEKSDFCTTSKESERFR